MNYKKLTTVFAFVLVASVLVFAGSAYAISEVTGTLSSGASTGNSVSGNISGSVTGGGSVSSGGGGGGGGGGSGFLASTTNLGGNTNTPTGQVLGASTTVPGFPTTGTGLLTYLDSVLLFLSLFLFVGYGLYNRHTQS